MNENVFNIKAENVRKKSKKSIKELFISLKSKILSDDRMDGRQKKVNELEVRSHDRRPHRQLANCLLIFY